MAFVDYGTKLKQQTSVAEKRDCGPERDHMIFLVKLIF